MADNGPVFFDGIYATDLLEARSGVSLRHYLRFYADGLVLCISLLEGADAIADWFNSTLWYALRGSYETDKDCIQFTVTGRSGAKIHFDGAANGNTLALRSENLETRTRAVEHYRYFPISRDS